MSKVPVQSRIDADVKKHADALFGAMGFSTADAIRMFIHQAINVGGLPFQPTSKQPNAQTIEAMKEIENGRGEYSKSTDEMFEKLGI